MPSRLVTAALVGATLVAAALISAGPPLGVDYSNPSWVGNNAAGESIEALAHGDLEKFFAKQPMMGSFSLVLRAPFVALADVFGGGMLLEYRMGSFACVMALGVLGLIALRLMGPRPWTTQALVLGLIVAGPPTFKALYWGHPEELLAAALAVGAIVAAPRRVVLAAVLLGLAIATKQWALLAVVPTLAAAGGNRVKLLLVTGAVAAAWTLPMAIGDFDRFMDQQHAAGRAGAGVTPSSVWWPFGEVVSTQPGERGEVVRNYAPPQWVTKVAEPLTLIVAAVLSLVVWRRRRSLRAHDALLFFGLLMLLRCMLDPMSISYHHAPFFVALAVYEALTRRGLPLATITATAGLLVTSELAASPNALNAVYLAWTLPLVAAIGLFLFAPRMARRLAESSARGRQAAPAQA